MSIIDRIVLSIVAWQISRLQHRENVAFFRHQKAQKALRDFRARNLNHIWRLNRKRTIQH